MKKRNGLTGRRFFGIIRESINRTAKRYVSDCRR